MLIDPVGLLALLLFAMLLLQVFWRVTRWLTSAIIFLLIIAILLPQQTKGLLGAVFQLFTEAFRRILFVLGQ